MLKESARKSDEWAPGESIFLWCTPDQQSPRPEERSNDQSRVSSPGPILTNSRSGTIQSCSCCFNKGGDNHLAKQRCPRDEAGILPVPAQIHKWEDSPYSWWSVGQQLTDILGSKTHGLHRRWLFSVRPVATSVLNSPHWPVYIDTSATSAALRFSDLICTWHRYGSAVREWEWPKGRVASELWDNGRSGVRSSGNTRTALVQDFW
jgi:hypothetical protein